MALQEFQRLHDYSVENGHQILSNSVSNSSTNSNASAFSISSNVSENGQCPTLPRSFIDANNHHQCVKTGLIKHPLLYQHTNPANSPLSNHLHHFHHKTRPQNIIASGLHRKIEYTGSSSSNSTLSSGCVSASSSSHHFPFSSSAVCSPSSASSSGPQTPQSNCYVQSPLAQSFTTDSGLSSFRADQSTEIKKNSNTIKKIDLSSNKKANANRTEQLQRSLLNLPSSGGKKDTDDESLLSDYSKDLNSVTSNLSSINATSTTNLVAASAHQHQTITAKPSLPGASSSFFHYPNIYNPLKNSKSNTKNNKKLIRFMTVLAYVIAGKVDFYYFVSKKVLNKKSSKQKSLKKNVLNKPKKF